MPNPAEPSKFSTDNLNSATNQKKKKKKTYRQGYFVPRNPEKYIGDPTKIVYRSSWELKCMKQFDGMSDIIAWNSEDIEIPYRHPDGRIHKYHPDFFFIKKDSQGNHIKILAEVKPYKETVPPKGQGKKKSTQLYEQKAWQVNQAKWEYAKNFCEKRGWIFVKLTEKDIL